MDTASSEFSAKLRLLTKLGIIALAVLAIIHGVITLFLLNLLCIVSGIILVVSGFLTICIEGPALCTRFKFIEPLANLVKQLKPLTKFIIYLIPGVAAIILCPYLPAVIGGLALITVAAGYFVIYIRNL